MASGSSQILGAQQRLGRHLSSGARNSNGTEPAQGLPWSRQAMGWVTETSRAAQRSEAAKVRRAEASEAGLLVPRGRLERPWLQSMGHSAHLLLHHPSVTTVPALSSWVADRLLDLPLGQS